MQAVIEGAWRLRRGQRFDHEVKDALDRLHPQALLRLAQIAARAFCRPVAYAARV